MFALSSKEGIRLIFYPTVHYMALRAMLKHCALTQFTNLPLTLDTFGNGRMAGLHVDTRC